MIRKIRASELKKGDITLRGVVYSIFHGWNYVLGEASITIVFSIRNRDAEFETVECSLETEFDVYE